MGLVICIVIRELVINRGKIYVQKIYFNIAFFDE